MVETDEQSGVCELVGEGLTVWSVSADGQRAHLGFEDATGQKSRLNLPFEALSALLLTIPRIMRAALLARGDRNARVVQPLGAWQLEQGAGTRCIILTLATPMGFEAAFAMTPDQLTALSEAAAEAGACSPCGLLN